MAKREMVILLAFVFVGWAACAATMGIGMAWLSIDTTLIVHAIGAPIYFIILSLIYFMKCNYTSPLKTAVFYVVFIVVVDFFLVAWVINKSLDMFRSFLGTWLPFLLIFCSTWVTGKLVTKQVSD